MRKNRNTKLLIIIALIVSIVGLTLGFAAFSNTLVISSKAHINPSSDSFKVQFSSSDTGVITSSVSGESSTGATAGTATINGTTISNLTASFTGLGQSVTYTFYVHNTGEYEAYLKTITFENVTNNNAAKVCTAKDEENSNSSLINAACEDISVTIKVKDTETSTSIENITGHSLPKKSSEMVTVIVSYENNNNKADGDFKVAFGDISLMYSSAEWYYESNIKFGGVEWKEGIKDY